MRLLEFVLYSSWHHDVSECKSTYNTPIDNSRAPMSEPDLFCEVSFCCEDDLQQVGELISQKLFGDMLKVVPSNDFEEFPAVRLTPDILGMIIRVVQSAKDETKFTLLMEMPYRPGEEIEAPSVEELTESLELAISGAPREVLFPNRIWLDDAVLRLLKEVRSFRFD